METEIVVNNEQQGYIAQDYPWLEMPTEWSLDDEIRYSLDEIRIG